jgi:hypothetical protein
MTTIIYEDNLGTMAFALDEKSPCLVKHIDVRCNFVKSHIADNTIKIVHMPSSQMTADICTKFLPPSLYEFRSNTLGLATSALEGCVRERARVAQLDSAP